VCRANLHGIHASPAAAHRLQRRQAQCLPNSLMSKFVRVCVTETGPDPQVLVSSISALNHATQESQVRGAGCKVWSPFLSRTPLQLKMHACINCQRDRKQIGEKKSQEKTGRAKAVQVPKPGNQGKDKPGGM